jgi:hypothetical protein
MIWPYYDWLSGISSFSSVACLTLHPPCTTNLTASLTSFPQNESMAVFLFLFLAVTAKQKTNFVTV